ncbi:MAG: hypothetical protein H6739_37560 [Alphaproteobacteria bacterium]|nr:hypothetical protein [Alphaproteobacteria bacterium]
MITALPFVAWMIAAPRPDLAQCDARMQQMAGLVEQERVEDLAVHPAWPTPTLALGDAAPSPAALELAAGADTIWMEANAYGENFYHLYCKIGRYPPHIGVPAADGAAADGNWRMASQELAWLIQQNPDHPDVPRWSVYLAELYLLDGDRDAGLAALAQAARTTDVRLRVEIGTVAGWTAADAWVEARRVDTPRAYAEAERVAQEALQVAWWLPVSHPARVCPQRLP